MKKHSETLQEWTQIFFEQQQAALKEPLKSSILLFELKNKILSLPLVNFKSVCPLKVIHTIPHCKTSWIQGVVNIAGQLEICIALEKILDFPDLGSHPTRMLVLENKNERWACCVDKVFGTKPKGIVDCEGQEVIVLDEELLFDTIRRKLK